MATFVRGWLIRQNDEMGKRTVPGCLFRIGRERWTGDQPLEGAALSDVATLQCDLPSHSRRQEPRSPDSVMTEENQLSAIRMCHWRTHVAVP